MIRVAGLDWSLTATGVAYPEGLCDIWAPPGTLTGVERLAWFYQAAIHLRESADLVVMEGYSYGTTHNAHQAGELGGVVQLALWETNTPYVVVAPASLKKFATDNGQAKKEKVLAAAIRAGYGGDDHNEADSFWLRQLGLYHLGVPEVAITQYRTEVVRKLDWPAVEATP